MIHDDDNVRLSPAVSKSEGAEIVSRISVDGSGGSGSGGNVASAGDTGGGYHRTSYLTRKDMGVGEGAFDSIAWALEVHVKVADTGEYNAAVLYGNEDAPGRIDFFSEPEPLIDSLVASVWLPFTGGEANESKY